MATAGAEVSQRRAREICATGFQQQHRRNHRWSDPMNQITIFDTTLRDGEQAPGCSMTLDEKLRMAYQLESLGVDVIEAGFPSSSDGDFAAVREVTIGRARESGFDHIHAEGLELVRHAKLFVERHRAAGRLLAV